MEINWTVLALIVVGLFALSGFFKGWWKESITTFFLLFLVLLLYVPILAQFFIGVINFVFALIARVLPAFLLIPLADWLEAGLGIPTVNGAIQLDPNNGGTWLVILLIFVGLGILLGRFLVPGDFGWGIKIVYRPGWWASLLGALIGAFNGFLIISLILAYMGGGTSAGAAAASTGMLQAVAVPDFNLTDSIAPWIFIALAFFLLLVVFRTRVRTVKSKDGFTKVEILSPPGHTIRKK